MQLCNYYYIHNNSIYIPICNMDITFSLVITKRIYFPSLVAISPFRTQLMRSPGMPTRSVQYPHSLQKQLGSAATKYMYIPK